MDAINQVFRHGGARVGAGRKPIGHVPSPAGVEYDQARTRNESAKASLNEHRLAVERGEYVPREAVRQASATALAVLTQSLRAMPDNLERTLSLNPETVEAIERQVDEALTVRISAIADACFSLKADVVSVRWRTAFQSDRGRTGDARK